MTPMATPVRVAIVDDSAVMRRGISALLEVDEGVVVVGEAGDGDEAIRLAATARPDIMLMDIEMPRMGGLELIGRLRGERRTAQIPIVVVSSRVNPEHRRRARELGVRGIVAKPITRRKLLEVLAADGRGGA